MIPGEIKQLTQATTDTLRGPSLQAWWGGLRDGLLNVLFPVRCGGCRQLGSWWCAACQDSIVWVQAPFCPRCGQPQRFDRMCNACQNMQPGLGGIRSATLFEGPLRQAIHQFKYNRQTALAIPLVRLLESCWTENCLPVDVIVPVPLHPSRLRERGYNQSALLARHFAASINVPVVEDCLVRTRATASQMTLNASERQTNVEGAFACVGDRLVDEHVLLVDDVCTTGATLESCALALSHAGAASVWALTLARAK